MFIGVDRYDLATPAYSLYGGAGLLCHISSARGCRTGTWGSIPATGRTSRAITYCRPTPHGFRPDSFYKIPSAILYLSRGF